jgi:DNA-binding response OmpR family regulator
MKILVVEDDCETVDFLAFALNRAGFDLVAASNPATALALLESEQPVLVLLDIDLGRWNGLDLLRDLRRRSAIPVIMLTGQAAEAEKVRGLELGADDYITKPYSNRELIARIRAVLRRTNQELGPMPEEAAGIISAGPVSLNVREHSATNNGEPVRLTLLEFRMLHYLMTRVGRVVPAEELLRQVWGRADHDTRETMRVIVYRLRQKLGDSADSPRLLHTVHGVGVMFKVIDEAMPGDTS